MNGQIKAQMIGVGKFFSLSWELFKKHFAYIIAMIGILIGVGLIGGAVSALLGLGTIASRNPLIAILVFLFSIIFGLATIVVSTILSAGLIVQVDQPALGFSEAIKVGAKRFWPLFGAMLIVTAIYIGVGFVSIIAFTVLALTIILIPFAIAGLFLLFAWVNIKLMFVSQAIVLDNYGPGGAINKSWSVTNNYFWAFLGRNILLQLAIGGIVFVAYIFLGMFSLIAFLLGPMAGILIGILGAGVLSFGGSLLTAYPMPLYIYMYRHLEDLARINGTRQSNGAPVPPAPQGPLDNSDENIYTGETPNIQPVYTPPAHTDLTVDPMGDSVYQNDRQVQPTENDIVADVIHDEPVYETVDVNDIDVAEDTVAVTETEETQMFNEKEVPPTHEDATIDPLGDSSFENDFQSDPVEEEIVADTVHEEPVYDDKEEQV